MTLEIIFTVAFLGNDVNKSVFFFPFTSLPPNLTMISTWFWPICNVGSKISSHWYVSLLWVGWTSRFRDPRLIPLRNVAWQCYWTEVYVSDASRSQTPKPAESGAKKRLLTERSPHLPVAPWTERGLCKHPMGDGQGSQGQCPWPHPFLQSKPVIHCLVVFFSFF